MRALAERRRKVTKWRAFACDASVRQACQARSEMDSRARLARIARHTGSRHSYPGRRQGDLIIAASTAGGKQRQHFCRSSRKCLMIRRRAPASTSSISALQGADIRPGAKTRGYLPGSRTAHRTLARRYRRLVKIEGGQKSARYPAYYTRIAGSPVRPARSGNSASLQECPCGRHRRAPQPSRY